MKYKIGKRYFFSPYTSGKVPKGKRYLSGILTKIDDYGNGILSTDYDEDWVVPLENLLTSVSGFWNK